MLCFPCCAFRGGLPSALDPVIETLQNLALPMAGSQLDVDIYKYLCNDYCVILAELLPSPMLIVL